jgi:GT2 family glycosyltransferase/glycosyltransferase involved in cell wall biosynthesis
VPFQQAMAGDALRFRRGDVVVCIPVFDAAELFARCLTSVIHHATKDLVVLIADDASADPAIEGITRELSGGRDAPRVIYQRRPENLGFVRNLNRVFADVTPADVVILNSDCAVTDGWLERLRNAAYSDSRIATVSTLTNHGTIVSIPHRNKPQPSIPQDWTLDELAGAIRIGGTRLYPIIPTAIGHCVFIRRSALDLAGPFDEAFSPGYEEEVDFSQRCTVRGLVHILADDVFVLHEGGGSFKESAAQLMVEHHDIVKARYPYYDDWITEVAHDEQSNLAQSLAGARRALGSLSVTVDGRILTPFVTGTQIHVLEVIAALATFTSISLRVVVPPDLGDYARQLFSQLHRVSLIPADEVVEGLERSDVFHRPFQVSSPADLEIARTLGRRLVVTHQDLIAYHNPGYFESFKLWVDHRRLTRNALSAADRVVFFSYHAARDARHEQLADDTQSRVVYIGTDHRVSALQPPLTPPRGSEGLVERDFLLCLGTDFHHKNRAFAARLLGALRRRHGWDGELVLAGPHVAKGSSAAAEALAVAHDPDLDDRVRLLPAVSEGEKGWLLAHATAVVYPTIVEGFGLIPFEAADAGLPCLFASGTSLAEVLPSEIASLVPWDAEASADAVIELLHPGEERSEHVRTLRMAGARFTWRRTAQSLEAVYRETAASPTRQVTRMALDQLALDTRLTEVGAELKEVRADRDRVEHAMPELQGELHRLRSFEALLGEPTARALTGIAYNPVLRRLILGPIRLLYGLRHPWRQES